MYYTLYHMYKYAYAVDAQLGGLGRGGHRRGGGGGRHVDIYI